MIYDKNQVLESTKDYFRGDDLATDAFMKYCLKDGEDFLELNPTQMHRRLASEFARIESKYPNPMSEEKIFNLFDKFEMVVPQGSPMSGIGNPYQIQSISNCFVIDSPYDSYAGILHHDQEQIQIMKRRGGVGGDASTIRPKNMATSNAARTTDGVGIFIERWSNSTREVAQGGRRGARMISLDCRHPEIETFIDIKRDLKKVTGANISVRWTDEFMKAVEDDKDFILRWPIESSPETAKITKQVKARQIWNKFVDAAWTMAEPGALFWDTITKKSIADIYAGDGFKTESTNPCVSGETVVLTNAGKKTVKELADNNAQFKVLAFDTTENKIVEKNATAFKTKDDAKLLKLTTKSGKTIKLTPDHRVYTQRGWVEAAQLTTNDKVIKIM